MISKVLPHLIVNQDFAWPRLQGGFWQPRWSRQKLPRIRGSAHYLFYLSPPCWDRRPCLGAKALLYHLRENKRGIVAWPAEEEEDGRLAHLFVMIVIICWWRWWFINWTFGVDYCASYFIFSLLQLVVVHSKTVELDRSCQAPGVTSVGLPDGFELKAIRQLLTQGPLSRLSRLSTSTCKL